MAGRISALGIGDADLNEALTDAMGLFVADPVQSRWLPDAFRVDAKLVEAFAEFIDDESAHGADQFKAAMLFASPDEAVESAICFARRRGSPEKYKIVSLVGSDHGRTAACRTASGRPELHDGYGPLVAGFMHVPADSLEGLKVAVDDSTAAVLISPIDLGDGAVPVDGEFLKTARQLCDDHDALLIVDEQLLCIGSSGSPFSYNELSHGDVSADALIVSAGLFAGLPGAALLAGSRMIGDATEYSGKTLYPLSQRAAIATLSQMKKRNVLSRVSGLSGAFAERLEDAISGFSFVRNVSGCGLTLGIQTDLAAEDLAQLALKEGLVLESAGETTVLIQPPPTMTDADQESLIQRLTKTLESMESRTATVMSEPTESAVADTSQDEEDE